ncbi:hypothetical protein ACWIBQ_08145 [Microbacterium keratanolyticum]
MRDVDQESVWSKLNAANAGLTPRTVQFGAATIELSRPCIALGGRNGAGKTRALRAIAEDLGGDGAFINLHHLIEQAHILYRSRNDLDEIADESGFAEPSHERVADLEKIIGRGYDLIEWSALDLVPAEKSVAEVFKWRGDQPTVPYFRVSHRGRQYTSPNMGLGEFSIHFLFWILEQYADQKDLTLLLDEPDAFLPPRGVRSLLSVLQDICLRRKWTLVLSTHSDEMIDAAVEHDAFVLLRVDEHGETEILDTATIPEVATEVLARLPLDQIIFVEDEVAAILLRAAIHAVAPTSLGGIEIVWGNGHSYMRELIKHVPRPPRPRVRFGFVFDGDQRNTPPDPGTGWQRSYLPTDAEPDEILRSARSGLLEQASMFGTSATQMSLFFDTLDGENSHDWVIKVGDKYERRRVLTTLAEIWARSHREDCQTLFDAIR